MVTIVLNKVMYLIFFLSVVNVIRHFILFIFNLSEQKKYEIKNSTLFYLGLSISFILTSIVTGIKL